MSALFLLAGRTSTKEAQIDAKYVTNVGAKIAIDRDRAPSVRNDMTESSINNLIERAKQYQTEGLVWSHALNLAAFEARIEQWPVGWGTDFVALVFGDFDPPDQPLHIKPLRITIESERIEGTVVETALTVLKANVQVSEKSFDAVKDAARRLNVLCGVLSWANRGAPVRWWSYITSPSFSASAFKLGEQETDTMLSLIHLLPPKAHKKVTAAFYWIREPHSMLREQSRRDALAVYAGYWNAFELLVSAANLIIPRRKLSPADKANIIRTDLLKAGANIGAPHIETLYRKVVDPGLRAEAEHALRTCMPDQADHFLIQCFKYQPSRQGLYRIRNAINHGTVDVDDPEMEMMVSARFPELWRLVFSMLGGLVSVNLTQKTNSR